MNGQVGNGSHRMILWLVLLAMAALCPVIEAQNVPRQRSRTTFKRVPPQNKTPAVLKMRVEDGTVTAEISNSPLHKVLEELAERTGIIFEVRDQDKSLVSVRLKSVSLTEAIQRIAADYNTIFFYGENEQEPLPIRLVRVYPRSETQIQPGIIYLGTGAITRRNDAIVTPEQALKALEEDAGAEEREKAVELLAATKSDEAIQALEKAVSDSAVEIRVAAIEGLAAMDARRALPEILKRLEDSHPEVRRSAAMAVGVLGDAGNLDALQLLSVDEDAGVAAAAEMAIRRLSVTAKQ